MCWVNFTKVVPSLDPNMSRPGASIIRRMQSGRRSLGFGTKKEKNKSFKRDPAGTDATENSVTEQKEYDEEAVLEEEQEEEELDEAYTLPEIPHTPISGSDCPLAFQEVVDYLRFGTGSGLFVPVWCQKYTKNLDLSLVAFCIYTV